MLNANTLESAEMYQSNHMINPMKRMKSCGSDGPGTLKGIRLGTQLSTGWQEKNRSGGHSLP